MEQRKPEVGDKVKFKEKYGDKMIDGTVIGYRVDKDEVFIQYIEVKEDWVKCKDIEIDAMETVKDLGGKDEV
jgi:hypothetical protein